MASRDLTSSFFERRSSAMKRRTNNGNTGLTSPKQRLTAGGTDDGHSLMLMEVSKIKANSTQACFFVFLLVSLFFVILCVDLYICFSSQKKGRRWYSINKLVQ